METIFMSMRPCDKCFENSWEFQRVDGYVRATCRFCGHEVEWKPAPLCRHCDVKLVIHPSKFKMSKLHKAYYYTATRKCPSCKRTYLDDEFKVMNPVDNSAQNR